MECFVILHFVSVDFPSRKSRTFHHPASGSLSSSLTSVLHPSGPSARHILLDLHLVVGYRLHAPHLHNASQETCRTQGFHQGRVSHHSTYFVDHINNHSSQNEHIRVLVNVVFAISPLMSALSTPIHEQFEQ
jgi:hypothetical protein